MHRERATKPVSDILCTLISLHPFPLDPCYIVIEALTLFEVSLYHDTPSSYHSFRAFTRACVLTAG